METQYRKTLNGLLAHAIQVAKGVINPPAFFVPEPAPPAVVFTKVLTTSSLAGLWERVFDSGGESRWTFTPRSGNQFDAVEDGLGNARGVAVVTGNHVELDWAASNPVLCASRSTVWNTASASPGFAVENHSEPQLTR